MELINEGGYPLFLRISTLLVLTLRAPFAFCSIYLYPICILAVSCKRLGFGLATYRIWSLEILATFVVLGEWGMAACSTAGWGLRRTLYKDVSDEVRMTRYVSRSASIG